jgi:hypothetical protein
MLNYNFFLEENLILDCPSKIKEAWSLLGKFEKLEAAIDAAKKEVEKDIRWQWEAGGGEQMGSTGWVARIVDWSGRPVEWFGEAERWEKMRRENIASGVRWQKESQKYWEELQKLPPVPEGEYCKYFEPQFITEEHLDA